MLLGNGIACILNRKLNDNCIRFGGDSCTKAGSNLLNLEMLLRESSTRKNKWVNRIKYDYVEEIHSLWRSAYRVRNTNWGSDYTSTRTRPILSAAKAFQISQTAIWRSMNTHNKRVGILCSRKFWSFFFSPPPTPGSTECKSLAISFLLSLHSNETQRAAAIIFVSNANLRFKSCLNLFLLPITFIYKNGPACLTLTLQKKKKNKGQKLPLMCAFSFGV